MRVWYLLLWAHALVVGGEMTHVAESRENTGDCESETDLVPEQNCVNGNSNDSNSNDSNDTDTMDVIMLGKITPSPILVVRDFLDEQLIRRIFDEITESTTGNGTEWEPVIPNHKEAYRNKVSSQSSNGEASIHQFQPPSMQQSGGFPGLRYGLTDDYQEALRLKLDAMKNILDETFEEESFRPKGTLQLQWNPTDSFFGNVCYDPAYMSLPQRLPHTDEGFIHRQPLQLALVHYLSPYWGDATNSKRPDTNDDDNDDTDNNDTCSATKSCQFGSGGTAFYAETASGGASRFRKLPDCQRLQEMAHQDGHKSGTTAYLKAASCHCRPGNGNMNCHDYLWYKKDMESEGKKRYMSTSTPHYELLHHVHYQFNTAVFYDAQQLHSAFIDDDDDKSLKQLRCHPSREGRITANIFLI